MACTRVGNLQLDGVDDGAVCLLRDEHRYSYGERVETLHVMSQPAGGQVRGYKREDGGDWRVWLPAYEGRWPEVDAAVAKLIGEPLIDINGDRVEPVAPGPRPVGRAS